MQTVLTILSHCRCTAARKVEAWHTIQYELLAPDIKNARPCQLLAWPDIGQQFGHAIAEQAL